MNTVHACCYHNYLCNVLYGPYFMEEQIQLHLGPVNFNESSSFYNPD